VVWIQAHAPCVGRPQAYETHTEHICKGYTALRPDESLGQLADGLHQKQREELRSLVGAKAALWTSSFSSLTSELEHRVDGLLSGHAHRVESSCRAALPRARKTLSASNGPVETVVMTLTVSQDVEKMTADTQAVLKVRIVLRTLMVGPPELIHGCLAAAP
jgi:hypothetical protein